MAKITGKTQTGYAFEFDDSVLAEWEFVTALAHTQSGSDTEKMTGTVQAVEMLVGKENMAKFIDHVKTQNSGHAPLDKIVAEFTDMLTTKNAKN